MRAKLYRDTAAEILDHLDHVRTSFNKDYTNFAKFMEPTKTTKTVKRFDWLKLRTVTNTFDVPPSSSIYDFMADISKFGHPMEREYVDYYFKAYGSLEYHKIIELLKNSLEMMGKLSQDYVEINYEEYKLIEKYIKD